MRGKGGTVFAMRGRCRYLGYEKIPCKDDDHDRTGGAGQHRPSFDHQL